eukprot:8600781-Pyramimonas_sp.AAC.1
MWGAIEPVRTDTDPEALGAFVCCIERSELGLLPYGQHSNGISLFAWDSSTASALAGKLLVL